ncbi:MAG TPA: antitoxin VapB family protein [Thermoplasmata archaeon]|nr:antitoxin VapB family protein [Thermoplasmata archaeon]
MGQKTVALDGEAYELLRKKKREGETFSDVVKRLARKPRSIMDFAGAWKDVPSEDLAKIREFLRRGRELDRRKMAKLIEEMH